MLGSLLVGTLCAFVSYFVVLGIWRAHIRRHLSLRRLRRRISGPP